AAKSAAETISAILIREPPPISRDSITVPSTLTQIVGKCLEKDRERRYQAAADVAQDLKNACRGCESRPESLSNEESTQELPKLIPRRPRSSFLSTSPRRAVLATGFLLVLFASVYLLFFRGGAPAFSPSRKSVEARAYDDYLRGHVLVNSENREDNASAMKLLEQATAANPSLAAAWADLARAYNIKAFYFAPDSEKKQLTVDAEVAVEKALTLDPNLAEAHSARGQILWTHAKRFPHEQAIQSFKRAIELNPN